MFRRDTPPLDKATHKKRSSNFSRYYASFKLSKSFTQLEHEFRGIPQTSPPWREFAGLIQTQVNQ